jgi:hypothetical protein
MKAPADTEAASEDIDEVIELPDVPTKAPERPEAPEKTKGFDLMLLSSPILSSVHVLSIRFIFFYCALMYILYQQFWKSRYLHSGWS